MKLAHPSAVKLTEPASAAVESPPSKRLKIDNPETTAEFTAVKESHNVEQKENDEDAKMKAFKASARCPICHEKGHSNVTCSLAKGYMRTFCIECIGTCVKFDDHRDDHIERLMRCDVCNAFGDHWSHGCPELIGFDYSLETPDCKSDHCTEVAYIAHY